MTNSQRQINKVVLNGAQYRVNLQKKIANYLNLDYSIINRSVIINFISNGKANIIVNNDWNNKVNFDLNKLS